MDNRGKRGYQPVEQHFDFVEQDYTSLSKRGKILLHTMDNPEVPDEDKLDVERELGHITFELWRKKKDAEHPLGEETALLQNGLETFREEL